MKLTKKIVSIFVMLTLVLALSVSAFAAGTITVTNAGTTEAFMAYKVLNVTVDGSGNYTYTPTTAWSSVVRAYAAANPTQLTVDSSDHVVKHAAFKPSQFADYLKTNMPGGASPEAFTGTPPKTGSIADGYYLVVSSVDNFTTMQDIASLVTVYDGNVEIINKNDFPFEKVVDDSSPEVGQTVNYTIEGKVPALIGDYSAYMYKVTDTMSAGLTFRKDVTVKIGGVDVDLTTVTSAPAAGNQIQYSDDGFVLYLDLAGRTAGDEIEISYSAVVNENAVAVVSENNAELVYSNDPTDSSITETKTDDADVYTSKIVVDKFENGAPTVKLADAEFVLYKTENATNYYYYYDNVNKKVEWVAAGDLVDSTNTPVTDPKDAANITKVVTNASGAAEFAGLEDGTYYLLETAAPTGYVPLTAPVAVVVDGHTAPDALDAAAAAVILTKTAEVANTPGTILPSTGGIGTTIFYILGVTAMLAAGAVIIVRKRETAE